MGKADRCRSSGEKDRGREKLNVDKGEGEGEKLLKPPANNRKTEKSSHKLSNFPACLIDVSFAFLTVCFACWGLLSRDLQNHILLFTTLFAQHDELPTHAVLTPLLSSLLMEVETEERSCHCGC